MSRDVLSDGYTKSKEIIKALTGKVPKISMEKATSEDESEILPVWFMPQGATRTLKSKTWLDFQNDVKVSDVELAAQELSLIHI